VIGESEEKARATIAIAGPEPAGEGLAELEMDLCTLVDVTLSDCCFAKWGERRADFDIAETVSRIYRQYRVWITAVLAASQWNS
jgi:hypothetical protein